MLPHATRPPGSPVAPLPRFDRDELPIWCRLPKVKLRWWFWVVLVGCGGSNASIGGDPDASIADGTAPGDGAGADGSSGADGAPPGDAGAFDGLAPDPGLIRCGDTSCDTTRQVCCAAADGGACTTRQICDLGRPLACDETADCPKNDVCCIHVGQAPLPLVTTTCQPSCVQGSITFQACKTSQECTGAACVAQKCGGVWFGTCGGIPASLCPP